MALDQAPVDLEAQDQVLLVHLTPIPLLENVDVIVNLKYNGKFI